MFTKWQQILLQFLFKFPTTSSRIKAGYTSATEAGGGAGLATALLIAQVPYSRKQSYSNTGVNNVSGVFLEGMLLFESSRESRAES